MTDLHGATSPPPEAVACANAGEFAAMWNAWTEDQRDRNFSFMREAWERASACLMMNHSAQSEEIEHLRTAIAEAEGRGWRRACAAMLERLEETP